METQDPGSGAIRLDKARDHKLNRFIELPKGATHVEVTRVDVPYFGIFNNHYDYATADQMMTSLKNVLFDAGKRRGTIIRDGGNLVIIRNQGSSVLPSDLENKLNSIVQEYANPKNIDTKNAMKNELTVKKAVSRTDKVFGNIDLYSTQSIEVLSSDIKLWDIVNPVL